MDSIVALLILGLIAFLIFLVCRSINCWYWKINRRVELLEEQNQLLSKILEKMNSL